MADLRLCVIASSQFPYYGVKNVSLYTCFVTIVHNAILKFTLVSSKDPLY